MEKTPFAGLTELDVSESILEDNGAFTGRDRATIDRFLQIGAKTHRHDGSAGLVNPAVAPSASVLASGGTIAGDLSLSIGYTLQDGQRGETVLSPVSVATTPGPLPAPQIAPSAAVDYTAGSLTQDNYYYGITYTDGDGGETPLGPVTVATRQPGYANARVLLSGLDTNMLSVGATAWRLYRQRSGGVFGYLASGTGATFTDDGTVAAICDTNPPNDNFNTTNSINRLQVVIPDAGDLDSNTEFINLYVSQGGTFSGQTFLEQFPIGSAGTTVIYEALDQEDGQPPDVNTSIGGAARIDPDTELEDWHWKRPVTGSASLGTGDQGDVRLNTGDGRVWAVLTDPAVSPEDWTPIGGQVTPRVIPSRGQSILQLSDNRGAVEAEAGSGETQVLVPADAVRDFPVGAEVEIARIGAGTVVLAASGGVTLRSIGGASGISAQHGVAWLRKRGDDDWLLWGDIG